MVFLLDVHGTVEYLIQEAVNKMGSQVTDIAEQTVTKVLRTCGVVHRKAFMNNVLRSLINSLLYCIPINSMGL